MGAVLTGKVVWRGKEFKKVTGAIMTKRLGKTGIMLRDEMKDNLSRQYPPASKPGEMPARRTGRLQRSMKSLMIGRKTVRVGTVNRTDAPYAIELELGSSEVAARPFVRPTVYNNTDRMQRILGAKVKFGGSSG